MATDNPWTKRPLGCGLVLATALALGLAAFLLWRPFGQVTPEDAAPYTDSDAGRGGKAAPAAGTARADGYQLQPGTTGTSRGSGTSADEQEPANVDDSPATLSGLVLSAAGERPLQSATVCAFCSAGACSASRIRPTCATSDQGGSFLFASLTPGRYSLQAVAERHMMSPSIPKESWWLRPGEIRDDVRLILAEGGGEVAGTVVDTNGRPVAGARVDNAFGFNPVLPFTVTCAEGHFSLWLSPPRDFIRVEADGFARAAVEVEIPSSPRIVLQPEGRLRGRVIEAEQGLPVPGVEVRVMSVDGWPRQGRGVAISGEGGLFEVTGLSAGQYRASVRDGAWYGESDWVTEVAGDLPGESLEVLVHRAHQLAGRVVIERSGEPCPNARVSASAGSGRHTTFADHEGRAILHGLSPGDYTVQATCDGLVTPSPSPVETVGGTDESRESVWPVSEGSVLRVEVVNVAGRPVTATVWIQTTRGQRVSIEQAIDGLVEVAGLQPGSYVVWASSEAELASEEAVVTTPRDEPVRLVMPSSGRIEGAVVDARGRPVGGALVMCSGEMSCASIPGTRRNRTDDAGRFVLAAPSGEVDLVVSPPFLNPFSEDHPAVARESVQVPANGVVPALVSLGRLDAFLDGLVLDGVEPASKATVTPWRSDVPLGYLRDHFEEDVSVATGGDGRFFIGPMVEGSYRLEVMTAGGKTAEVEVRAPDRDLVITLSSPGWVNGTVRHSDGTIPESFSILGISSAGRFRVPQQFRGTGGVFSIEPLSSGDWRFRAVAGETRGFAEATIASGGMARVEIVLAPAATVAGRIVEAGTNRPISGAKATLSSETVPLLIPFRVTSAPNGEFVFPAVDPGHYALQVRTADGRQPAPARALTVLSARLDLGDIAIPAD